MCLLCLRVTDVGPQFASCQLLYLQDKVMEKEFDYVLPKSNLRDSLFYSDVMLLI